MAKCKKCGNEYRSDTWYDSNICQSCKLDELKGVGGHWTYTEGNVEFTIEKIHGNFASDIIYTLDCISKGETGLTHIGDYSRKGDAVEVKNYIIKLMRMARNE